MDESKRAAFEAWVRDVWLPKAKREIAIMYGIPELELVRVELIRRAETECAGPS